MFEMLILQAVVVAWVSYNVLAVVVEADFGSFVFVSKQRG
jgi:hypothetical protein